MKALGRLVIVKATKGVTDTILYSQHATKIPILPQRPGGGGLLPNITDTDMCGPGF